MSVLGKLFGARGKQGTHEEAAGTDGNGRATADAKGIAAMLAAGVERRIRELPNDAAGQATAAMFSRLRQPEWLAMISSTLSEKMSDALSDLQLHSLGLSRDRMYVLMYAFPCGPEHALKTVYRNGYTNYVASAVGDWLSDSLAGVVALIHVQLFSEAGTLSLHLTAFPVQAQGPSMVVFPAELLTDRDRGNLAQLGLDARPPR